MSLLYTRIAASRRRIDPDAADYIAAVELSLGYAVSNIKKSAISSFIKIEQASGRWNASGRFFFPIWEQAAANAICMKTQTSGTFSGGVTHGAGFVQGNGSNGHFSYGVNPADIGITSNSGTIFFLSITTPTNSSFPGHIGCRQGSNAGVTGGISILSSGNFVSGVSTDQSSNQQVSVAALGGSTLGLYVTTRRTSTDMQAYARRSSGMVTGTQSTALSGEPSSRILWGLGMNGETAFRSNGKQGFYGAVDIGLSGEQVEAFTLNLKTLWETCTGLTLP